MGRVTEKKRIKIDHDCVDSPCFMDWLNSVGGREQWLFKKRQSRGLKVDVNGTYQPYLSDIEHGVGYVFETGRTAVPRLTMGASVAVEDVEGIETMLYSTDVLLLRNPGTWETDGPVWETVTVVPGTFALGRTDDVRRDIEITIELPYINTQST